LGGDRKIKSSSLSLVFSGSLFSSMRRLNKLKIVPFATSKNTPFAIAEQNLNFF